MIGARALRAGKAVIELSLLTGDVDKQLKKVENRLRDFGKGLRSIGSSGLKLSAAIVTPFVAAIKVASDAQESMSRFKQVFGEQGAAAEQFANTLSKSVGRSAIDVRNGLSTFQSFFVGLGFSAEKSRELSQQLQALSIDFASFNNLSDEESLQRFISALSGSSEVLDKFGINIKQAALEQELLKMGVKKSWLEVTEQEKSIGRLAIIMRAMSDQGAVGDAVRTSGSFANQLKMTQGRLKDLADAIGQKVIPVAAEWLGSFNSILSVVGKLNGILGGFLSTVFDLAIKIGILSGALYGLGLAFAAAGKAARGFRYALAFLSKHPIIGVLTLIAAGALGVASAFGEAGDEAEEFAGSLDKAIAKAEADLEALKKKGADKGGWFGAPLPGQHASDIKAAEEKLAGLKGHQAAVAGASAGTSPTIASGGKSIWDIARGVAGRAGIEAKKASMGGQMAAMPFFSMFERIQEQMRKGMEFAEERERVEDDLARARLDGMKDDTDAQRMAKEEARLRLEDEIARREMAQGGNMTPEMKALMDRLLAAQIGAIDAGGGSGKLVGDQSTFMTRFAAQQFGGGRREELEELRKIARHTDPRRVKIEQWRVPVGP